jgi:hypothetical protein
MNDPNEPVFENLFKETYQKYFGHPMTNPLSENESREFSKEIYLVTGLLVPAAYLTNYAAYILCTPESRQVNPSAAILDTLVRYLEEAPLTIEEEGKRNGAYFPYWFKYRDGFFNATRPVNKKNWLFPFTIIFIILVIVAIILVVFFGLGQTPYEIPGDVKHSH